MSLFDSDEEEETKTPDLQASAGLSFGGSGPQLMEMLQNLGPTPAQRTGQAMAGGVSAARGEANPVTPIINQQIAQQNQIMGMIQKMGAQQDLNAYRQETLRVQRTRIKDAAAAREDANRNKGMDIMKDLVTNSGTPESIQAIIQPQYAEGLKKQYGFDLPSRFFQRDITDAMKNSLLTDLAHQAPPEILARRHSWVNPNDLPSWTAMSKRPEVRHELKLADDATLKALDTDRQLKEGQLLEQMMPVGFQKNAPNAQLMHDIATELFPEVDILKLSRLQQMEISQQATLRLRQSRVDDADKISDNRLQNQIALLEKSGERTLARQLAVMDAKQKMGTDPMTGKPLTQNQILSQLKPFQGGTLAVRELDKLRRDLAGFPEEALPSGTDVGSRLAAKIFREKLYGGHESIANYHARFMNVMNGLVGRTFYDDKGSRTWESQKKEYEVFENLPSWKTIDKILEDAQDTIRTKLKDTLRGFEESGAAPEGLLNAARKSIGRIEPKAKEAQPKPMSPLSAPPKTKKMLDTRTGKVGEYKFEVGDVAPSYLQEIR